MMEDREILLARVEHRKQAHDDRAALLVGLKAQRKALHQRLVGKGHDERKLSADAQLQRLDAQIAATSLAVKQLRKHHADCVKAVPNG